MVPFSLKVHTTYKLREEVKTLALLRDPTFRRSGDGGGRGGGGLIPTTKTQKPNQSTRGLTQY